MANVKKIWLLVVVLLTVFCFPSIGYCSGIDGQKLSGLWVIPFVCMLLSIAVLPLVVPSLWHHHFGKISAFWGLAFLLPFGFSYGWDNAFFEFMHAMTLEYIPFIILLFALFTVAGGIRLKGSLVGTPVVNTGIFVLGTALASWMGTTGAAMLLIRPLLRANAHRKHKVHLVVFFIFLVANIGGCLTPLGDPPLFLGFLRGVDFFWTFSYLITPMLFLSAVLLVIHFFIDSYYYKKEGSPKLEGDDAKEKLGIEGAVNFPLLLAIVGGVLMSGMWNPGKMISVLEGLEVELQNLVRDIWLLFIAALSLKITSKETRVLNEFSWAPIQEVAKIFFGIFVSMIPAIAILKAGENGALSGVIGMVTNADGLPNNAMYFWLTGALSSFLDNAPTYLVFFATAGDDAAVLMTELAPTLVAISAGAVFMGANTYIGNAPNFMVRSIAEDMGVKMPSFFGYMAWSVIFLVPLFVVMTFMFFS